MSSRVPEKLRGQLLEVQAPGLSSDAFSLNFEEIKVTFTALAPGEQGTILLGWRGCLTCTVAAAAPVQEVTATARSPAGRHRPHQQPEQRGLVGLLSSPPHPFGHGLCR